jgi:hypothetical protein
MNRTLKRPMFRMGGSTGTGITSGLDRPGYREGTTVRGQFFPYGPGDRVAKGALDMINAFPNRMNAGKQPTMAQGSTMLPQIGLNQNRTPSIKRLSTEERMREALGERDKGQELSKFLINFGLNLASATPRGGLLATAAEAAKGPAGELFSEDEEREELERQIKLAAVQSDIGQEQAVELQMLKNLTEDDRIQVQKEAKLASENPESEFFGKYNEALAAFERKKIYGVQPEPGERRQELIENQVSLIQQQASAYGGLSNQDAIGRATFNVDFEKILKDNPDVLSRGSFDFTTPESAFYSEGRTTGYREGLTYYDPINRRYLRKDLQSEPVEGVPQGFVLLEVK